MFTSDNGPETMAWPDGGTTPFHGEKGTTWEGGFRVPPIVRWPGEVPAGKVFNGIFDGMDWLPTLVAAAGGLADLREKLLAGYEGYKVHLDGYKQLSFLRGEAESQRKVIFYHSGPHFHAVRHGDWKVHFVVPNHGWAGPREALNAPLLFNLRRDPYEKAAEESGMYTRWMGNKMWAFGPAKEIVQAHLASLGAFPPRGASMGSQQDIEAQSSENGGLAQ